MRYLPHTQEDIAAMLQAVGVATLDDLFASLPSDCLRTKAFDLPEPLTEWELDRHMDELAGTTATPPQYKIFMGAGSYDHYIPEIIKRLVFRSEFYTAYTPYQPEISQGTLQAIYEYQTLVTRLLGMEVANASMYDGASALAEALLMAIRVTRRRKVALARTIHPLYRRVVQTYFNPTDYEIVDIDYLPSGRMNLAGISGLDELAAVAVASPNFFGCMEDLKAIGEAVHSDKKTLLIVSFSEPLAFGLYQPPGAFGADIVCGEGQSLGIARSFGGPGLGVFATRKKFMRAMPGRLVGKTVDADGKPGFVLTLSTREQHIRREKATSNICSNQGLCALTAGMYMATLGAVGFKRLARINYDKTGYLKSELKKAGIALPFDSPTFNEFVIKLPVGSQAVYQQLLAKRIVAGLPMEKFYPELTDHYLLCVTETSSRNDLDILVKEVTS